MITIVGEVGSVHDGSFGNAIKSIEALKMCGADFVKFQTHLADEETLADAPSPNYFNSEDRYNYFKRTAFTREEWVKLKLHCEKVGIGFISSPFSIKAALLLEDIGVQAFKLPSGEVTNLPLIHHLAAREIPVIMSTGMSNWDEIDRAVVAFKDRMDTLTLLQCSSIYPCPPESVGINILRELKVRYSCNIGFSDHTLGNVASILAVSAGATIIEKHFTFSRLMYGSDAPNATEPSEFKEYCRDIKEAALMLTSQVDKNSISRFADMKKVFEKSIVINKPLSKGNIITIDDISFLKPGTGISASEYQNVIGKILNCDISANTILQRGMYA